MNERMLSLLAEYNTHRLGIHDGNLFAQGPDGKVTNLGHAQEGDVAVIVLVNERLHLIQLLEEVVLTRNTKRAEYKINHFQDGYLDRIRSLDFEDTMGPETR